MQSETAIYHNERMERCFKPFASRRHSPPQRPWQGPLPPGVKEIMTRAALGPLYRPQYAKWAANFVRLENKFTAQVMKEAPLCKWAGHFGLWYTCEVGNDLLCVQQHDGGWSAKLFCPDSDDRDVRILTIENMPVLCRDARSARRLAEACYPKPPANLVWHSHD